MKSLFKFLLLAAKFVLLIFFVLWVLVNFTRFALAATGPESFEDTAKEVCIRRGYTGPGCYQDLLAIAQIETHWNCQAIGKAGERGCFQIMPFHGVSVKNAEDFKWAANWTLKRLERYGYPEFRTWAIQCHNGCNRQYKYANKVKAAIVLSD